MGETANHFHNPSSSGKYRLLYQVLATAVGNLATLIINRNIFADITKKETHILQCSHRTPYCHFWRMQWPFVHFSGIYWCLVSNILFNNKVLTCK